MPKRNDPQAAEIGKRIYKLRKEKGLTQEELAYRSGLSQSFLTCVERGEKGLGFDSIIKISHVLESSTDYLLLGRMPKKELDYIYSLFEPLNEAQRDQIIEVLKGILLISGFTLPEQ